MTKNDWKARLKALSPCPEAYKWAVKHKTLRQAWRMCEDGDWMYWLWYRCRGNSPIMHLGPILDQVSGWGEGVNYRAGAELFEAYIILDFMPDPPELPKLCQE